MRDTDPVSRLAVEDLNTSHCAMLKIHSLQAKAKRNFSLISFACSLIFFAFVFAFAQCEQAPAHAMRDASTFNSKMHPRVD